MITEEERRRRRHNPPRQPYTANLPDDVPGHQPAPKPKPKDKGDGGGHGGGVKQKAARRYIDEAQTLQLQAQALRIALNKHGFKRALKIGLANINQAMHDTDDELMRGYNDRLGSLQNAADDNDKAADSQTFANLSNAGRERANAMSEIAANGGGESDQLRAQQMSLRNWNANQSEVNRSYYDTLSSVNSSLTDLTADTRSARVNNALQAQADKGQLWTNYYNQRSETLTQLGNTLGQMAEYYGMAEEQVGSKKSRRRRRRAARASGEAFRDASHEMGRGHHQRGAPGRLEDWDGADPFDEHIEGPKGGIPLGAGAQMARPEGATLRSWT